MKDNFSSLASGYALYRPTYPSALFEFIYSLVTQQKLAWDCGTGNGQTAAVLAASFEKVIATDISLQQLEKATPVQNVEYRQEPAEHTTIAGQSVNLITVSQALHWFHFDSFYTEVRRVAAPGAVIAAWTYSLLHISPEIDALVSAFHNETLGSSWDAERHYVMDAYRSIPFPFPEIAAPPFAIETNWTLPMLQGYLDTWSRLKKVRATHNTDPLPALMQAISSHWQPGESKPVSFPLHLRIGRVE